MAKNIVKLRLGAEISELEGRGSILIHRSQRVKKTVDPPYKYPCNSATSFLVEGSFSAPKKKNQNEYFSKIPKILKGYPQAVPKLYRTPQTDQNSKSDPKKTER